MRQRELQVFRDELLDVGTFDEVGLFEFNNFEDLTESPSIYTCLPRWALVCTYMNRPESGTMSRSHVLVQCLYRIRP